MHSALSYTLDVVDRCLCNRLTNIKFTLCGQNISIADENIVYKVHELDIKGRKIRFMCSRLVQLLI